jgi:hypothetical protein
VRGPIGFVLRASGSKVLLLSMFIFCLANYSVLLSIRGGITRQIGVPPFDFGGDLTSVEVYEQLPLYTDGTRTLYRLFFVSDFFAPLGESVFFLLVLAAVLRGSPEPLRRLLIRINAAVLALVPLAVDWAENVGFLIAIERYPQESGLAITLAVFFHQARLALLPIVLGGLLLTLVLGICLRWQRRTEHRPSQARTKPGLTGETT